VIRIRHLRLVGVSQNYDVPFCGKDGSLRPLSIIAGQISTGKTAVLEFIDYCLGQDSHPSYVEIQRQARTAQLELELSGAVHVIERPLFSPANWVWLHRCRLADVDEPHETTKIEIDPAGSSATLNWLLLRHSQLEGVVLKEAPTKPVSETDPLSFRDVMWLAFLTADRMGRRHLLFETGDRMKQLKLKQLIEVVFDVHDQTLAGLGDRIARLRADREAHLAEIEALKGFLAEQDVRGQLELEAELGQIAGEIDSVQASLASVSERMRAEADFADQVRQRYTDLRREAGLAAARVRDRETLLGRLLPLQAQYAEDERKLVFYSEAKHLFDPLKVRVCPSCLSELDEPPEISGGRCTLCSSVLEPAEDAIDVEAERAAIRARLRGLGRYIGEVQEQLDADRSRYGRLRKDESTAQAELDRDLASTLAPFVGQRDELVRRTSELQARSRDLQRQRTWLLSVERRTAEVGQLEARIQELRDEQRELEEDRPSRDAVIHGLTVRFDAILRDFGFPKLEDPEPPRIDTDFVPYVRGVRYDALGSRGAMTLIALAWQLAIFQLAVERNRPHPGFLMVDSPQANLKPATGGTDEYSSPEIGDRLWRHLSRWTAEKGRNAQLIVVDHVPPTWLEDAVVRRYSGLADDPPYGFIANETSASGADIAS
jgi:hypothetical protein